MIFYFSRFNQFPSDNVLLSQPSSRTRSYIKESRPLTRDLFNGGGALISDRIKNPANNFLYDNYMENDLFGQGDIVPSAVNRLRKSIIFFKVLLVVFITVTLI